MGTGTTTRQQRRGSRRRAWPTDAQGEEAIVETVEIKDGRHVVVNRNAKLTAVTVTVDAGCTLEIAQGSKLVTRKLVNKGRVIAIGELEVG